AAPARTFVAACLAVPGLSLARLLVGSITCNQLVVGRLHAMADLGRQTGEQRAMEVGVGGGVELALSFLLVIPTQAGIQRLGYNGSGFDGSNVAGLPLSRE